MQYSKLVRDNIPELLAKKGKKSVTHIATDREYGKKLEEKLQEEVQEFLFSKSEEELADIQEVLSAIIAYRGLEESKMKEIQEKKAKERGRFTKRIILEEVS